MEQPLPIYNYSLPSLGPALPSTKAQGALKENPTRDVRGERRNRGRPRTHLTSSAARPSRTLAPRSWQTLVLEERAPAPPPAPAPAERAAEQSFPLLLGERPVLPPKETPWGREPTQPSSQHPWTPLPGFQDLGDPRSPIRSSKNVPKQNPMAPSLRLSEHSLRGKEGQGKRDRGLAPGVRLEGDSRDPEQIGC